MTDKPNNNKPIASAVDGSEAPSGSRVGWGLRLLKMTGYRVFRLSGELTAIAFGLGFLWCYMMSTLLAQKTLDVSMMEPNVAMWFTEVFDGRSAEIGEIKLRWRPGDNSLTLDISGIEVKDKYRVRRNHIDNIQSTFDFEDAMRGRVNVRRAVIDGGAVTIKRAKNGEVVSGMGTPETVGKFSTLPSRSEPIGTDNKPPGLTSFEMRGLDSVSATNTTVYIVDAVHGVDLRFEKMDVSVAQEGESFLMNASANITHEGEESQIVARASFSTDYEDFDFDFSAENLNPAWYAPKQGQMSKVNRLNAPVDLTLKISSNRDVGLTQAELNFEVGAGECYIEAEPLSVNNIVLSASYDPAHEVLNISNVAVDTVKYAFAGIGQMTNIGRPAIGFLRQPVGFNADLSGVMVDRRDLFEGPFNLSNVTVTGGYDRGNNSLILNDLKVKFPDFEIQTRLELARDNDGQIARVAGKGQLAGQMTSSQLVKLWPTEFADGARRWIDRAILEGVIDKLNFDFSIPGSRLKGGALNNDNLTLQFSVRESKVKYISTMTPYTNAAGSGVLRGNSFEFDAISGNVGGLNVKQAHVAIPRLSPKGGDLQIEVKGQGGIAEMLSLIDQKPFEFASLYGIEPEKFSGVGDITLTIARPLLENFDRSEINYAVAGEFSDVKVPFSLGNYSLENGKFLMSADKAGMSLSGPVNLGPWAANLEWEQPFSDNPDPTKYRLFGPMDRAALDGFGIGLRKYFGGKLNVDISAEGKGLAIADAKLNADLTDAELRIGEYWTKDKGVPAGLSAILQRGDKGEVAARDFKMEAPGLSLVGDVAFAEDMRLLDFELKRAKVEGLIDGALKIAPSVDQTAFEVTVDAAFLDVSPFVMRALATPTKSGVAVPINLTASLERLALSEGFILSGANLEIVHNGVGTEHALIKGTTANGSFLAQIAQQDGSSGRTLNIDIPDASRALSSFFNINSLKGGRLQVTSQIPDVGADGPVVGTLEVENFVLVNAPVFAQMLSLASLKGLSDAMGGAGLNFDELEIPFAYEQGKISVREGRASGPALGLTGSGDVDISKRFVDVDGVLVPAYTTNSALASIPVIGDIFVGKKGEGIFALNYSVKGPFKSTQVAVNPLSALTPGFLRRIFETQRDDLPEVPNKSGNADEVLPGKTE